MKFVYFPSDVPYFHLIDLSGVVDAATLVYRVTFRILCRTLAAVFISLVHLMAISGYNPPRPS